VAAILLVDSDEEQSEKLRVAMEAAGWAMLRARTHVEALDVLRDGGIDLTVVHYTTGMDLEGLARGMERLPDPPPFALVSGALDAPEKSAHFGAAEFIARPFAPEDLIKAVTRLLAARSSPSTFEDGPTRPNQRRPDGDE
jgi:DNA-binding NtrC family response regulator